MSGPREILYTVYKCPGARRRRRVLPLPAPVQTDKARARFQDGVAGDPDPQDRGSREEEPQGRHRIGGDAMMQKKLTCRAMGMNCGFEIHDESEEEILAALGDHAKRVHKVSSSTKP